MNPQIDKDALKARLGLSAFESLCDDAGLTLKGNRCGCPVEGCQDDHKGLSVQLYAFGRNGEFRWHCHRCDKSGDVIEFAKEVWSCDFPEACQRLGGDATPKLAIVKPKMLPGPIVAAPGDLLPATVAKIWQEMATSLPEGEAYLTTERGIHGPYNQELIRFAHPAMKSKEAGWWHKEHLVVCMATRDVNGQFGTIQCRRIKAKGDKAKVSGLKGQIGRPHYFGRPDLIEAADVVCVTEGMMDTASVAEWAEHSKAVIVGAPGKNYIPKLAHALRDAGISVEGKTFVLFPQNDRPQNQSRTQFSALAAALKNGGATIMWVNTPAEYTDVADWRCLARASVPEWPPYKEETREPDSPVSGVAEVQTTSEKGGISVLAWLSDTAKRSAVMQWAAAHDAKFSVNDEFWFNELENAEMVGKRRLTDSDVFFLKISIEAVGMAVGGQKLEAITEKAVYGAVQWLCRNKVINEAAEWVKGLKWDGKARIRFMARGVLGVKESIEEEFVYKWMLAAVKRITSPGCKFDSMLVLQGKTGAGKSLFFSAIGGKWFSDKAISMSHKNDSERMTLRTAWIFEMSELTSMRGAASVEHVKQFLAEQDDSFRAPYGKIWVKLPRHAIFGGTCNPGEIPYESAMQRRLWTVRVNDVIDLDWVKENREQLFAEAYEMAVVFGEDINIDKSLYAIAAEHVATFMASEADEQWAGRISAYINLPENEMRDFFPTHELADNALHYPIHLKADGNKLAAVMKSLGFEKSRARSGGPDSDGNKSVQRGWKRIGPGVNGTGL